MLHGKRKVFPVIARSRLIQTVPLSELSDCFLIIHDLLLDEALACSWFAELMFRGAHGLSHKPLSAKSGKDRFKEGIHLSLEACAHLPAIHLMMAK